MIFFAFLSSLAFPLNLCVITAIYFILYYPSTMCVFLPSAFSDLTFQPISYHSVLAKSLYLYLQSNQSIHDIKMQVIEKCKWDGTFPLPCFCTYI